MSCEFTTHTPHFPILLVRYKVKVVALCVQRGFTDTNPETSLFRLCLVDISFFYTVSTVYAFKSFRDSKSWAFPYQAHGIKQTVEPVCSYLIAWMRATHAAQCAAKSLFLLGGKRTLTSYLANDLYLDSSAFYCLLKRTPFFFPT